MKRPVLFACSALALALAGTLTTGCEGNGRGVVSWSSYHYDGWYDNYYGPFHDGYWGTDGYFWFRLNDRDRNFRRDDRRHFRRDNDRPDSRYQRFGGAMQPPPQGTRMPRFPRNAEEQDRERDRDRDRDRN